MSPSLTSKIEQLHRALVASALPHAFGGALALAFCVQAPRATADIDLNVFVGADRLDELREALPRPVRVTRANRTDLERDGQTRAFWAETPVDLFLSNHPFHDHVAANVRTVPFASIAELPVLSCGDLAVFKAFFGRAKDAVDVGSMVAAGAIDAAAVERTVEAFLRDDRRDFFARVGEVASEAAEGRPFPRMPRRE